MESFLLPIVLLLSTDCVVGQVGYLYDLAVVPKRVFEMDRRALNIGTNEIEVHLNRAVPHQVHQSERLFLRTIQSHANGRGRKENVDS